MNAKVLFVVALIGFSRPCLFGADSPQSEAEQQLIKVEHDWADSYVKQDPSFPERITADDFQFIGPDGNVANKVDYVKSIPGPTVFTAFKIESIKVRIYGDAAVVIGVASITAKTGSRDESGKYAFTDTFIKQNGEWKAVSGQATAIAKPK